MLKAYYLLTMNSFVDFTDINPLKTHDRAHSYELGVTRRPFANKFVPTAFGQNQKQIRVWR